MSKKTNLRQTQIVTLTDYHRQEIEEINQDKENMLKEYEKKKEGVRFTSVSALLFSSFVLELRSQLMKKEHLLSQTKRELDAMGEYKVCSKRFFISKEKCSSCRQFKNNRMGKSNVYKMKSIIYVVNTYEKSPRCVLHSIEKYNNNVRMKMRKFKKFVDKPMK